MSTFTFRAKRRRSALRTVAFLSPWLIGFGVFFAYPLVSTVYFSLMKYDGFGTPAFRGLGNWSYVFNDYPMFWPALGPSTRSRVYPYSFVLMSSAQVAA